MLGRSANWVRNVEAARGAVTIRHGRREAATLEPVESGARAPILRRYLELAPGARAHLPVDELASSTEFERIAPDYPVFRIVPSTQEDREAAGCVSVSETQPSTPLTPASLGSRYLRREPTWSMSRPRRCPAFARPGGRRPRRRRARTRSGRCTTRPLADQGRLEDLWVWTRAERLGLDVERCAADRRSDAVRDRVRDGFRGWVRQGW
jgi:hypothetical protein